MCDEAYELVMVIGGELGNVGAFLGSIPEAPTSLPREIQHQLVSSLRECKSLLEELYLATEPKGLVWVELLRAEEVLKELDRTSSRKGEA